MRATKRTTRTTTRTSSPRATDGAPVLGLGANVGDPRRQILQALIDLSRHLGPIRVAPLYRSAAISDIAQPPFLNTVAWLPAARVSPRELLALAQSLEAAAGRRAGPRNAPRPLDIDILVCGRRARALPGVTLPHPRMRQRSFVLAPLAALLPELPLPPDGATPRELLKTLPPDPSLERLSWGAARREPADPSGNISSDHGAL